MSWEAVVLPIIERVITPVVGAIGRQFGYLFCYKTNIKILGKRVARLENSRTDAESFFERQKQNNEETAKSHAGWLNEIKGVIKDAEEIKEATDKLNSCLNLKDRYVLSRKSTKLAVEIQALQSKVPQGITTSSVIPAGRLPGALANKVSKGYKTRIETIDEVMKALEDQAISVIGICGMGGVGKTTMVHEVRERTRIQNLFDEIAMTTVSENQDLFKIQGDLAKMLGLTSLTEVKNVIARADQLSKRLSGGNKVLVILDDVWHDIDLKKVGIPSGSELTKCKIVITSRQKGVCTDIQKSIEVKVLAKEEARALFRKTAGEQVEKNNLGVIADEVADECKGLPIALLTLSSALSDKGRQTWEDARTQLRNGRFTGITGMDEHVYLRLQLSYDFLATEKLEAQSLLLLCCQHQEDAEIEVEKLAQYCLSLDLLEGVTGVVGARNRVYSLVEHLKSCFLLQAVKYEEWEGERVKMHDVIRDVCLSIVSRVKKGDRVCMHFWKKEDGEGIGTSNLDYQEVKLFMQVPLHNEDISGILSSLGQMQQLRVLESAERQIGSFARGAQNIDPSLAPQFPKNLQMLSLERTAVGPDILSEFTRLIKLQILSFASSTILSFPHQIGELSNLKLLDLRCSYYNKWELMIRIPSGILPKLTKLEVLFMGKHYFPEAPCEGEDDAGKESCHGCIEELDSLSKLTTLQIDLLDPMQLLDLICICLKKLELFCFRSAGKSCHSFYESTVINLEGINWLSEDNSQFLRRTSLECKNYSLSMKNIDLQGVGMKWFLEDKIRFLLRSALDLRIKTIKDLTDPSIFKNFTSLRWLEMRECNQLECIIHDDDATHSGGGPSGSSVFTNLEIMAIRDMENVRELCHNGHLPPGSLRELKVLYLNNLPKMTLLWDPPIDSLCLANLKVVYIFECGALKCLFPYSAAKCLSQLRELVVRRCHMLNRIISKGGEGNATGRGGEITEEESNGFLIHFPMLKHVTINESPKLLGFCNLDDGREHSLFSSLVMLPSIEDLEVRDNQSIKALFDFKGLEAMTMREDEPTSFCKLQKIELRKLPKLEHLCKQVPKDVHIFQNLITLRVTDCGNMAYLIPSSIAQMLANLKELIVKSCKGMKEVISAMNEEDCGEELDKKIVFHSLKKIRLDDLENLSSFCSSDKLVFEFPSLEELSITICPEIETFCYQMVTVAPSGILEGNVSKGKETTIGGEIKIYPNELATLFPKLKKVEVEDMPNFRGYKKLVMLPSLKDLVVRKNHSIKAVFDFKGLEAMTMGEDERTLLCKLQTISLESIPKLELLCKQVPKDVHIFKNLTTLAVYDCGNMEYLIPSSIAQMLVNLQELHVRRCKGMKEVISTMNEENYVELYKKIVFRSLKDVSLINLENISSFCSSEQHLFEFPSLETLYITSCPEIETFCFQTLTVAPSEILEENVSEEEETIVIGRGEDIHPSELAALFPKLKYIKIEDTPNFQGFYNIDCYKGYQKLVD